MSKKNFLIVTTVLIALLIGITFYFRNQQFIPLENPDKELTGEEYNRYWERLAAEYKKDFYGGGTPEETLNMFISALKAGDLKLASKYFVVEKQQSMLKEFQYGRQNGGLSSVLKILEEELTGVQFDNPLTYEYVTSRTNITIKLVLNTYTNKWKIYEL